MITIFQDHHSGMDWRRGFHFLFRTSSIHGGRRNLGSMDGFEPAIHGTGYPLPGEYDELVLNLTK
ncbi:hypothetical protein [Methyloglobulus sp.]|uniref:hypothetical protein n=1 Tax=Methyloglobulus sp. TaxID=2518622 RepID=UPI0039890D99